MKDINLTSFNIDFLNNITSQYIELIVVSLFILFILISLSFMFKIEKLVTKNSRGSLEDIEKYLKLITNIRELLEDTRKTSFDVLQKANNESLNMLKENSNLSEGMQDLIRRKSEIIKKNYLQELKKGSELLSNQFQESYKKEFANGLVELKNSHNSINKKLLEESQGLITDIHKHMTDSHDLVIKKIDEDMGKTENFLEEYRQNKINEFEREFKSVVSFYVKDYLKKSLSFEEHEEIIKNIIKDFEKNIK